MIGNDTVEDPGSIRRSGAEAVSGATVPVTSVENSLLGVMVGSPGVAAEIWNTAGPIRVVKVVEMDIYPGMAGGDTRGMGGNHEDDVMVGGPSTVVEEVIASEET